MQELILDRKLQRGDVGGDVLELQRTLIGWGSKEQPVILDGVFGIVTENAVERFQRAHALEPDGIVDEAVINAIKKEAEDHPFDLEDYKCTCGECGGFGFGRYENEYLHGKPHTETFHMYEYPGIDVTLVRAVQAMMHRAEIPEIHITSGYRCWIHNNQTGRTSTNHLGKAVDFISKGAGEHNGSVQGKIECTECARMRRIGIEECGFQAGWSQPNRISLEIPRHGAYTWVHIDTRCIPGNLRRHVKEL